MTLRISSDRRKIDRRRTSQLLSGREKRGVDRRGWSLSRSDRRTLRRLQGTFPVLVSHENGERQSFRESALEVSPQGLRIKSAQELAIGERCNVCIYLPELFVPVQALALVRWRRYESSSKTYVAGVSFEEIGQESKEALDKYIHGITKRGRIGKAVQSVKRAFYKKLLRRVLEKSTTGRKGITVGKADSGITFEHIYSNKPSGEGRLGRWIDRALLNLPAARASRFRKELVQNALLNEIDRNTSFGISTKIVDLGSGPGTYLLEAFKNNKNAHIEALAIDKDKESIMRGRAESQGYAVRFLNTDLLKHQPLIKLSKKHSWKPNLVIVSGLIYYWPDDVVKRFLETIYSSLSPGGLLILTNMIKNPNKDLVGHLFTTQSGSEWVPVGRAPSSVRAWLADIGFNEIRYTTESVGMYNVFTARKRDQSQRISNIEVTVRENVIRGKLFIPTDQKNLLGNLIFIPGLGYTPSAYKLDSSVFANNGFGLCTINMPGHGNSNGEWTLTSAVDATRKVISSLFDRYKGDVPTYVLAHSTGALIALLASLKNHKVAGIGIVNLVNSVTDSYQYWHKSGYSQEVKKHFLVSGHVPAIIEEFLNDPLVMARYRDGTYSWEKLKFGYRYGLLRGESFANLAEAICWSPDILSKTKDVFIPTIMFVGKEDNCIDPVTTKTFFEGLECKKKLLVTDSSDHFQKGMWQLISEETVNFFSSMVR